MVPEPARRLWRTLAADDRALHPHTTTVVRGSRGIAPAGWVGVVRFGDASLIEAGQADDASIARLRALDDPSDPAQVEAALQPDRTMGPALLAYLPGRARVPDLEDRSHVEEVPVSTLRDWLAALPDEDVDESSVAEMEQALVLRRAGIVLGAAGHLGWPAGIGHVGVLVAPDARGAGVGTAVAAAATRRVLDQGLTPQWRAAASNLASRTVARRLGYREMGRQFCFELDEAHAGGPPAAATRTNVRSGRDPRQ
ncbi:GNAT family N-acetyltransferase [Egicoccus sp. AB-alg2]|uniref:GNAT family N-acetyltransferase n=1 Tax=Egicoccus sp. AB-alg2 TaxID=3242693 RepID=UPI00359CF275